MTSTGNRTQVVRMLAQCFTHYATTANGLRTTLQRRIQSLVNHLRWSFLQKLLTAISWNIFLQKALSWMFGRVLNTSLYFSVLQTQVLTL